MLQPFRISVTIVDRDVAKVDRDIANVAMDYAHMFQVYILNVSSVSVVYCKCFHLDVAKVALDVAYTCMLQAYVLSVLGVSYVCCKCFIWILHMFVMVFKCFFGSFCKCFIHMFQVFQRLLFYVGTVTSGCLKVEWVLHMGCTCESG
jgi:hypothetical protein